MGKKTELQPACRDYTLNLHKRLQGIQFKKRAPRAIRNIRRFATKEMHTQEVRIDPQLNRMVWATGIRNIPRKIRVRVTRKRNEDEDSKEKFFSLVQYVEVDSFEELQTQKADRSCVYRSTGVPTIAMALTLVATQRDSAPGAPIDPDAMTVCVLLLVKVYNLPT
eukprot:CAMPEP_0185567046 /NCGR_PEP_ID=MMETSP0434-20130131/432_1 /TAXON_ID=626734 ORGANISM="Favella taraikaensis, Strain Fe Narragansett Bay" /NCGR_SAMPLE_ID=MMETSP0434 /ASSEMBLY_ACC=CAM_ASM_000379 /LENGTH=164 /DNA_ID=CAMNT_0028181165 /DNA_START=141 /DNA_END=636 /DNA_ORIENTATION=+